MNFILTPPSLEHRALVKIAITLWSKGDIRDWTPPSFVSVEKHWNEVENIIAEKAFKLPLPEVINEKLVSIIGQVGLEILSWMEFHTKFKHFETELPDILDWTPLVWTPNGTIDKRKTAEVLAKDERIDGNKRFNLACIYCLKDDILELNEKFKPHCRNRIFDDILICFWFNYLFEEINMSDASYKILFNYIAVSGNEVAVRYLSQLRPEHANIKMETAKRVAVSFLTETEYCRRKQKSDVLCFLLSILDAEQQEKIFQSHTYEVLTSLLVWPRQSQFLEIAKNKWKFLSKICYEHLLHDIVDKMRCKRSCFKKLFLEFWQQTPQTYKQFVTVRIDRTRNLLLELYKKGDERSIQVILKDLSISVRKKLMLGNVGHDTFKFLIQHEKWDSVKYLIQECISSPEEMAEFKNHIRKSAIALQTGKKFLKQHQWNTFLQMVNDFIIENRKRKFMEDHNTSCKKVCCKDIQE